MLSSLADWNHLVQTRPETRKLREVERTCTIEVSIPDGTGKPAKWKRRWVGLLHRQHCLVTAKGPEGMQRVSKVFFLGGCSVHIQEGAPNSIKLTLATQHVTKRCPNQLLLQFPSNADATDWRDAIKSHRSAPFADALLPLAKKDMAPVSRGLALFCAVDECFPDNALVIPRSGRKLFLFDFDLTLTKSHTNGACHVKDLTTSAINHNLADPLFFSAIVPRLVGCGHSVGIVTYCDDILNLPTEGIVGGRELVDRYLSVLFGPDHRRQFLHKRDFQCWYPPNRGQKEKEVGKNKHIQAAVSALGVHDIVPSDIVLFDDTRANVDLAVAAGHRAVLINPEVGFGPAAWYEYCRQATKTRKPLGDKDLTTLAQALEPELFLFALPPSRTPVVHL